MRKRLIVAWVLLMIFSIGAEAQKAPQRPSLRRIVIDAGHGGSDQGAKGELSTEANIALNIALKLEQMLREQMPDVDIIMTRRDDVYPSLYERCDIANRAKADLFISIHLNSAPRTKHKEVSHYETKTFYKGKGKKKKKYTKEVPVYRYWSSPSPAMGTETYIWSAAKNESKKREMMENEDAFVDSSINQIIREFDSRSPENAAFVALKAKQFFERSQYLAFTIEDEFKKIGRVSREARQRNEKGIWVLEGTSMPSVLVETGFISNPEEEKYLYSDAGQRETSQVIINALKRYKNSLENRTIGTANGVARK
jgi:N-acetylmuramoyl-L-alanine amidase